LATKGPLWPVNKDFINKVFFHSLSRVCAWKFSYSLNQWQRILSQEMIYGSISPLAKVAPEGQNSPSWRYISAICFTNMFILQKHQKCFYCNLLCVFNTFWLYYCHINFYTILKQLPKPSDDIPLLLITLLSATISYNIIATILLFFSFVTSYVGLMYNVVRLTKTNKQKNVNLLHCCHFFL
jgi:hypothetical protein